LKNPRNLSKKKTTGGERTCASRKLANVNVSDGTSEEGKGKRARDPQLLPNLGKEGEVSRLVSSLFATWKVEILCLRKSVGVLAQAEHSCKREMMEKTDGGRRKVAPFFSGIRVQRQVVEDTKPQCKNKKRTLRFVLDGRVKI